MYNMPMYEITLIGYKLRYFNVQAAGEIEYRRGGMQSVVYQH